MAWGDFLELVGPKTRNMIRKATRAGYSGDVFQHNDHLKEIDEINTSLPVRAGRPMADSYTKAAEEIGWSDDECQLHSTTYVGVFLSGDVDRTLVAYCQLAVCGELAIANRFIGHGDHLRAGVMNILIQHVVHWCWSFGVRRVNYLTMPSATTGIEAWKRHNGFRPIETSFVV